MCFHLGQGKFASVQLVADAPTERTEVSLIRLSDLLIRESPDRGKRRQGMRCGVNSK